MQVGSLVECIYPKHFTLRKLKEIGNKVPEANTAYTIREITVNDICTSIRLEEIVNEKRNYRNSEEGDLEFIKAECSFDVKIFKQLLPPINEDEVIKIENLISV